MEALTRACLRRPGLTLVAVASLTAALGAGLPRLDTDVGYRAFLGHDHEAVRAFDDFLERFGGGWPVAVAWACGDPAPCESVFDPASLRMAERVALELRATPGVRRAEGPGTSVLLLPTSDGFALRRFVENRELAADREVLAARALEDPLWVGSLVSGDGRVGAILLELASSDGDTSTRVFGALERALAPYREQGFQFSLVGGPVDFVVAAAELRTATERLIPMVALAIAAVVWLLFRSFSGVAATLGSMAVAVLWTMGSLGWLGWPQNTITQMLPPLVLVVGSCNGIHVLARYAAETARLGGTSADLRRGALERVAADVGGPCALASLTTAAGFLSFATSGLQSFVRFGAVAALGVLFALLLSFSLLPVLLAWLPEAQLPRRDASVIWDRGLAVLVRFAGRRSAAILVGSALLVVACGVGAARLRVDVSFEDLYGEQSQVVQWVRFVETHLRKPETLEIELRLPKGERATEPDTLAEVERLAAFLAGIEGLGPVHSVLEPLGWAHRLVQDDDPAYQRPGETRRKNAQLLALLSLDDPHRLEPWLTLDQSRLRISAEASKVPQEQLREIITRVEAYLAQELPPGWGATLTGAGAVIHALIGEVQRTQLTSFATAALVVLLLVAVFLGSPAWALLAMIPTGLPVVLTLGAMSFAGIALNIGTAMVAAVVIGIAIDDTVHLLIQYRRRRRRGLGRSQAIGEAVPHVGRALVTTSIALALGFFSLLVSPWQSVASFGLVAGLAILVALVADLVVLPALLLAGRRATVAAQVPICGFLLLLLAAPIPARADPAPAAEPHPSDDAVPPSPRSVMMKALANRYELDARASVEITIVSKSGGIDHRRAEVASKFVDGQVVTYGRFTYPEDMRGMAVLRLEHADRDDDFFAFLPEFRRVRRLSAAQKSDLFIGTDAAFEDVERRKIDDYKLAFLPSREIEGEEVWILDARPTYDSGYERVEYSIAKNDSSILRTRHFKRGASEPFKIIETPRVTTEAHGGHTIPMRATVRDLERGTRTELRVERILVNPELDDKLFTNRSLSQERRLPDYDELERESDVE